MREAITAQKAMGEGDRGGAGDAWGKQREKGKDG